MFDLGLRVKVIGNVPASLYGNGVVVAKNGNDCCKVLLDRDRQVDYDLYSNENLGLAYWFHFRELQESDE